MPLTDKLATALLVTIWGLNFVVISVGLRDMPPILLGALRFFFVAFPAVFFVRRPRVPLLTFLGDALTIGFAQFAFMFSGMSVGMPAGVASLVLQTQAFFTVGLSALAFGDRYGRHNFLGLAIALAGLVTLAAASVGARSVPALGFALTLCAALSWAAGNLCNKKIGKVDPIGLVAWSGLFAFGPFIVASLLVDGVATIRADLAAIRLPTIGVVAYLSIGASFFGYGI